MAPVIYLHISKCVPNIIHQGDHYWFKPCHRTLFFLIKLCSWLTRVRRMIHLYELSLFMVHFLFFNMFLYFYYHYVKSNSKSSFILLNRFSHMSYIKSGSEFNRDIKHHNHIYIRIHEKGICIKYFHTAFKIIKNITFIFFTATIFIGKM